MFPKGPVLKVRVPLGGIGNLRNWDLRKVARPPDEGNIETLTSSSFFLLCGCLEVNRPHPPCHDVLPATGSKQQAK